MRNNGALVSIAAVCLVLGIMIAIQFKSTQGEGPTMVPARVTELTEKVDILTDERNALAEEVLDLREKLKNVREYDKAMADMQKDVQNASMAAGLLEIEGAGIIVTINDSLRSLQIGEDPNTYLVHDTDILFLVNELKASGAEAISVNGERITAMSEIRCAGTLILVNWIKIAPPFEIKAIGNPDMLDSGINIKGGILSTLKNLDMQVSVQKEEHITIPAYSGRMKFSYASPVQYKEKAAE